MLGSRRGTRAPGDHLLRDIRSALEAAGIEFIAEKGRGLGVRLVAANRYRAEAQIAEAEPSAAECCNSAQAQRAL
jgi:hypothetical protein